MKRKSIIFLGLIVLLILSLSLTILAKEQVYDFRKTNWGMSKKEVMAIEGKVPDYEGDNSLGHNVAYKVKIGTKDYACIYVFLEDKLYSCGYVFDGDHTNKNDYINDYEDLKEILIKKYNTPNSKKLKTLYDRNEILWKDDLYKDDESKWGLAISVGDLSYSSIWETPTTDIELILDGDNYKIVLRLRYHSKELKEWANKILEEKAKSNF